MGLKLVSKTIEQAFWLQISQEYFLNEFFIALTLEFKKKSKNKLTTKRFLFSVDQTKGRWILLNKCCSIKSKNELEQKQVNISHFRNLQRNKKNVSTCFT